MCAWPSLTASGGRGHVQEVMTPSPLHLPWGLGPLSTRGGPWSLPIICPPRDRRRGGVILLKVHFLIYKCSREMWAPSLQWVSEGTGHMSTNRVAGRGWGDSGKDHPHPGQVTPCCLGRRGLPPEPLPLSSGVCLPGLAPSCLHPSTRWGVGGVGGSQGSLPIPAAQLPTVLILAALRVVHLVDTETLLEVLGPDLGVQDLLSHVAGEPASLLVMQTLAEDPA